jgi:uncharacterized protein (TIGR01777 family)
MNVLISGASGLVGTAVVEELGRVGHVAVPLTRGAMWDVKTGRLDLDFDPDAVVHLAGENIAAGKWTEAKKQRIRESRVDATRKLADNLAALPKPPRVFLSASAIGFYGPKGDKKLIETSPSSTDFLGEVCAGWEKATLPLERAGVRVVHMRFGIILSPKGGALAKMLPAFKMGLGGPLGDGSHWMSWVGLKDAARAVVFLLENESASGAVNIVSPNAVTNEEFARTLAGVLRKPAFFRMPAGVLRMLYGEFAETLLASQRVQPQRLQELGFQFARPELDDTLCSML